MKQYKLTLYHFIVKFIINYIEKQRTIINIINKIASSIIRDEIFTTVSTFLFFSVLLTIVFLVGRAIMETIIPKRKIAIHMISYKFAKIYLSPKSPHCLLLWVNVLQRYAAIEHNAKIIIEG